MQLFQNLMGFLHRVCALIGNYILGSWIKNSNFNFLYLSSLKMQTY